MTPRFLSVALAAAFVFTTTLAFPASAKMSASERTQTLAKIRAMKRHMIMQKAQQRILKARVAARPGRKMPKGFRVVPPRSSEGGGLMARVRELRKAGTLPGPDAAAAHPVFPAGGAGGSFGPNKLVNDPTTDVFGDAGQSETSIAASGNNILLTWNDGNGFDLMAPAYQLMSYGFSTDGGNTWTDGGGLPQPPASPNWQWSSDPVVTVNESNNEFLFTGLVFPAGPPGAPALGTTNGVAFVKGTFTGGTFVWGTPVLVASGLNSDFFHDKQWVAVDPGNGNIYLTYTLFTLAGDQIEFRRSTNGGTVWSSAATISDAADEGYVQGSRVAVGPSGEVYTVWTAVGPGPPSGTGEDFFKMRKSTNGGVNFGTEVLAAQYFSNFSSGAPGFNRERGITYPGLAVDRTNGPDRGRIYLSWNESIDYYQNDLDGGAGNISEPESGVQVVNNNFISATPFTLGNTVRGTISNNTFDRDFYRFTATQGQTCVFFVDSISAGLDMAFRLFCSDTLTSLAISSPGVGYQNLIVWTAPATGNYYIRPAAWSNSDPAPHPYRIRTIVHAPVVSDRARDHRDIFVSSSADGLAWPLGAQVRVNDDPAWFDNWLPEVAVTGHSRVFCTWYDWRDANPTTCGGESNLYLYRSNNGGAGWSNLGRITDATTSWSSVASNVAPNQGDYIALFANYTGVYTAWGDGRDSNPDIYAVTIPIVTPTLASLASSRVEAGRVELNWSADGYANQPVNLERRDAETAWSVLAAGIVDGSGQVRFVDATVAPGHGYTYRLAFEGGSTYSREARIAVPAGPALSLSAPQPNPVSRDLWLSFSLPSTARATLSLVDIAGRVIVGREVGELGAGEHRLNLGEGARLAAGVYVIVLRQGDRVLTRRVSVVP